MSAPLRCCLLLAGLAVGCAPPPPPAADGSSAGGQSSQPVAAEASPPNASELSGDAADLPADAILKRLLETYRTAKTYSDEGVVRLEFRQNEQPVHEEWPVAASFERPNKLSLVAYQATVKCDGQELKAKIDDPASGNVDGQMVVRSAPREFKLTDLASDALLYDILSSRLRRQPIQLELLLESGGLVSAFGEGVACRRLADGEHAGRRCFRVEVPSPGGAFVFWIDQRDGLLRRLDYPVAALLPDLASDPSVKDAALYADLRGARIGGQLSDETFALAVPADAKRVQSFVVPPQPLPTNLLGKTPERFEFTDLEGDRIGQGDLQGGVTVLVWYHDHPACEATLQQVSLARERIKPEEAAFLAVATDPTTSSHDALRRRLAEWQVKLPIVRDLEAFGDKAFHIDVQPTIVVLDSEGRIQVFQPGGNPQLADQLVAIVERLNKGENLAADVLSRHERQRQQYEALVARGGPQPGEVVELPEAVIKPRSEPKRLKIAPLWTCSEIKSPGNLLVAENAEGQQRVYAIEGWRTVAEIDVEGKIVRRHALELPEEAAVTYLRTATSQEGRRWFAASAPLAPQVFLFDANWKLVRAFPAEGDAPLAVVDVAFADLGEADGTPELLVASVANQGLLAFDVEGAAKWRNRAFANAVSVVVTPPDDIGLWNLYVTGESGSLLRVNRFGHEEPPVAVPNWSVLRLSASRFSAASQAVLLGLATNAKGEPFAVGLTASGQECWNYPLPPGVHSKPIDPVASSELLPGYQGEWWLAGPDGSVHVVSEDGKLHDSFYLGTVPTGIAAAKLGDQPALLVATEGDVKAFAIDLPSGGRPPREY